eukprot:TRINITY_DN6361_c0_g3_i1.p1 TRINITY_DN6361_c0_g3~~TRINITY_DN6361_c0_g3_i1.p1  ORF type:complete len:666 (-),score=63.47 TRINITY_DN6361_c0_g3_i1:139-2136(-)
MSAEADDCAIAQIGHNHVQSASSLSTSSSCQLPFAQRSAVSTSSSCQLPFAQRLLQLFNAAEAKQLLQLSSQQSGMHVDASRWCITREDLRSFAAEVRTAWEAGEIPEDPEHPNLYHNDPSIGPNIYAVNEHFIKPRTLEAGVSWALMKHPEGLPCDAFVTHSWHEGIFEFAEKVQGLWPSDARHLYCCFLSNPQNGDVSAMLGQSAVKSPFAVALARSRYLLVVPNHQQSIYTRLWCVFEAHLAMQLGLQICLPSRPLLKDMLLALVPRLALTCVACVLQFLYMQQPHVEVGELTVIRLTTTVILFSSPCLPQLCDSGCRLSALFATVFPFALLGFQLGIGVFVFVFEKRQETPKVFWIVVHLVCMILVSLTLIQQSLRALAARVVASESGLLDFESVRNATCSHPGDENNIREALAGDEDLLDSAIRTLRVVGCYNRRVHEALWLGVPAGRLRHGTGFAVMLLAAVAVAISTISPLCSSGLLDIPHPIYPLGVLLLATSSILYFVLYICPDPRVLATDSLLLLALCTGLLSSARNRYYLGHWSPSGLNTIALCEEYPWYLYLTSVAICFGLWFLLLRFVYGKGLRLFMQRFWPDGLLVAGTYSRYDRGGSSVDCDPSKQESVGRVLSYVSDESRDIHEAAGHDDNEEAAEEIASERTAAAISI